MMAAALLAVSSPALSSAWDLKDVLGGSGVGDTVSNLIEGVFTKTDLEVKDFTGVWTADGSAVTFKSDNLLKKAGGVAAAAALEAKLDPYFKQYGLTGAIITVNPDNTFTLQVKKLKLSGTIDRNDDGTFNFNFKVAGKLSLGSIKTYVQKSGNNLEVMFDATKLKMLVSTISGFTGSTLAKTFSSLLDSYDGLCVGFGLHKTGEVNQTSGTTKATGKSAGTTKTSGTTKSSGKTTDKSKNTGKQDSSASGAKSKIEEALKGLLGN